MVRISFCTSAIGAATEVHQFIDSIFLHNQDIDLEVVMVHDDRSSSITWEDRKLLAKEHPKLKLLRSTKDQSLQYLDSVLHYYDKKNIFPEKFRRHLANNLKKYRDGTLFDENRGFLWLSTGWLYNRAVEASTGDLILVSPADFIHLYSIKRLADFVQKRSKNGIFYGKMGRLRACISNQSPEKIRSLIQTRYEQREQVICRTSDGSRSLSDLYLVGITEDSIVPVDRSDFTQEAAKLIRKEWNKIGLQPCQHGQHVMTRKTWENIGGFSEEYYGRAWTEDRMTHLGLGLKSKSKELLPEFSFIFATRMQKERAAYLHQGYPGFHKKIRPKLRKFFSGIGGRPIRLWKSID